MKKINVCAYARVSTDKKDQENSFENQQSYFNREITKNPNYQLVEVYADKGLTATDTNRKDFLRMVEDAGVNIDMYAYTHQDKKKYKQVFTLSDREPLFNKIFVKNTSRFARNIDIINLLRILRKKNVHVEFLDINKSTENEADFVFIEMLLVFDENESRDKSRKTQFGQLEGMKNGVIGVSSRIYGYKVIDKYTLEIIPDEAKVIKFIFEQYSKGYGVRVLRSQLKEKGYKTRKGKDFGKTTVLTILKNPKYMGDNVRNRYTTGTIFVDKTSVPREKDEEDWIVHKDAIPAIVTEELFNKCEQIRLSRNVNQRGRHYGTSKYAGFIKCSQCGANYIRNVDRGKYFYNCSTKKTQGVKVCDNINVKEEYIDEALAELADGGLYADLDYNRDFNVWQIGEVGRKIYEQMQQGIDTDKQNKLRKDLEDVKEQKDRLADLFLSGRVDMNYFDDRTKDLDIAIKQLEENLKYMYNDKDMYIEELKTLADIQQTLENLDIKETYSEEEIMQQVTSITIERNPENEKEICLTFDYKLIEQMNELVEKYL